MDSPLPVAVAGSLTRSSLESLESFDCMPAPRAAYIIDDSLPPPGPAAGDAQRVLRAAAALGRPRVRDDGTTGNVIISPASQVDFKIKEVAVELRMPKGSRS